MSTLDKHAKTLCEEALLSWRRVAIHPGTGKLVPISQTSARLKLDRLRREVGYMPSSARKTVANAAAALWIKVYKPLVDAAGSDDFEQVTSYEEQQAELLAKARETKTREQMAGGGFVKATAGLPVSDPAEVQQFDDDGKMLEPETTTAEEGFVAPVIGDDLRMTGEDGDHAS